MDPTPQGDHPPVESPAPVTQTTDWKHHLTTPTKLSKYLAMVLFVALPFVGFWLGVGYGSKVETSEGPFACTPDVQPCPGGSYVNRTGPNCEFAECPVSAEPQERYSWYENIELGFSFKYPQSWQMRELQGTVPSSSSQPGGHWSVIGVALNESAVPTLPKSINPNDLSADTGSMFVFETGEEPDYLVLLNQYYCGTFECEYSALKDPFSSIHEFNIVLEQLLVDGYDAVLARGGHYECYDCTEEVLSRDNVFLRVCNEGSTACLTIKSSAVPDDQIDRTIKFFKEELIPSISFTDTFDALSCTAISFSCGRGI